MSSKFHNNVKPVKSRPHGHIHGAKLSFPLPKVGLVSIKVPARVVRVIVGESEDPNHWAKELVGKQRIAIECVIRIPAMRAPNGEMTTPVEQTLYLDNHDGQTLWKVTAGKGHPALGLKQLPVAEVLDDKFAIHSFYRVEKMAKDGEYRIVMGA